MKPHIFFLSLILLNLIPCCLFTIHSPFGPASAWAIDSEISTQATSGPTSSSLHFDSKEAGCQLETLKKLGWIVNWSPTPGAGKNLKINEGHPCERDNLDHAMEEGDLQVSLGPDDLESFMAKLPSLLESDGSLCGFKFKYKLALDKTMEEIKENMDKGRLKYISKDSRDLFEEVGSSFWRMQNPLSLYFPAASKTLAVECYTHGVCQVDCALGLQLSELAVLKNMFGKSFETIFTTGEVAIGIWSDLQRGSDNPFHGRDAEARHSVLPFDSLHHPLHFAHLGKNALVGTKGIIQHDSDSEEYLDDQDHRGENFVLLDIAEEAVALVKKEKSFKKFSAQNRRIWEMMKDHVKNAFAGESFSKDLGKNRKITDALERDGEYQKKLQDMLNDPEFSPIYNGIIVYAHPFGSMSFGEYIKRLLAINPRSPYKFLFYADDNNSYLFNRYVKTMTDECLGK